MSLKSFQEFLSENVSESDMNKAKNIKKDLEDSLINIMVQLDVMNKTLSSNIAYNLTKAYIDSVKTIINNPNKYDAKMAVKELQKFYK